MVLAGILAAAAPDLRASPARSSRPCRRLSGGRFRVAGPQDDNLRGDESSPRDETAGCPLSPVPCRQRIFSVANATRAQTTPMIQKRITTLVSFQPICSKWWCSGAMRKIRRPVPVRFLVHLK